MAEPVESLLQPLYEKNIGENLFQQICNLGVGRFYLSTFQMTKAKPASTDTLGRLEALKNGAPEIRMNLAVPFAVSLPVDRDESQHLLVFQDGRMVLVRVFDQEGNIQNYKESFGSYYAGGDLGIIETFLI